MENAQIETKLAVLVYLPEAIAKSIQSIKDKTGVYYPDHESSVPHITLYSCKFDEAKYSELLEKLQVMSMEPFSITIGDLHVAKHDKNKNMFVSFGFEDIGKLQELHEKVLAIANPLRGDLIRDKDIERFEKGIFSEEEFSFIKEYGYQYVKKFFNSHITIGEVDENKPEILEILKEGLEGIKGQQVLVDRMSVKLSYSLVPENKKVRDSEVTEILLK